MGRAAHELGQAGLETKLYPKFAYKTSNSEKFTTADSPTNYWLANRNRYPVLLAPTSIPSGQVFSTAGDILTDKRNCLSPDNAEKLMIMNENLLKF